MLTASQQDSAQDMGWPSRPRFGERAAERAADEWGCNCGPAALAAIMNMTLDEVRPHMGDFESKGYTNPTLMFGALKSVGARYVSSTPSRAAPAGCWDWPNWGLCRVQWEGPWTKPGVPIRARYRQTHWIGVCHPPRSETVGIFDVNCLQNGSGWVSFLDWEMMVVPWLLKNAVPRADGKWHLTHAVEVAHAALNATGRP